MKLDKQKPSLIIDSSAKLLLEKEVKEPLREKVHYLVSSGPLFSTVHHLRGTCTICSEGTIRAPRILWSLHVNQLSDRGKQTHRACQDCIFQLKKHEQFCPMCRELISAPFYKQKRPHPFRGITSSTEPNQRHSLLERAWRQDLIDQDHFAIGVTLAVESERLDILTNLLESNMHLSAEHRGIAVCFAAERRLETFAAYLLSTGEITTGSRGNALLSAIKHGSVPMTEALLQGELFSSDLGTAVVNAVINRKMSILKMLLRHSEISEPDRSKALQEAVQSGQSDAVNFLLKHAPPNWIDGMQAIHTAQSIGHYSIALKIIKNLCSTRHLIALTAASTLLYHGHVARFL